MPKDGDTYNVGQGVGVGRNVKMDNVTVNQFQSQEKLDLPTLAQQLATLRSEMKKEATEPEHDIEIGAVAAAEAAAKKGDEKSALDHLQNAGKWAVEMGLKVGVPVAVDAIKRSAGL